MLILYLGFLFLYPQLGLDYAFLFLCPIMVSWSQSHKRKWDIFLLLFFNNNLDEKIVLHVDFVKLTYKLGPYEDFLHEDFD